MESVHIVGIIIVILIVLLLLILVKNVIIILVNSVIGVFALLGYNVLFDASVKVSIWSVIITAIGGIFGFAFVLIMHYLHLGF